MVKATALALACAPLASAFPAVMELNDRIASLSAAKRAAEQSRQPVFKSGRGNTGVHPAPGFDAKSQLVDVSQGSGHEFQSPSSSDLRGQCPGLNAAANHGFLPRSGIVSIEQTVTGLGDAYNMSPDLALGLAVISVGLSGDPVTETWSIGGAYPGTLGLSNPGGIYSLHSKYEGDASIVRGDAYLNNGQVNHFDMDSWTHLWEIGPDYNLDNIAAHNDYIQHKSIMNNPYYFTGFFSGAVAPAAHNFVINFMSNHTSENPNGYLNHEILSQFFAVTGDGPGNFVYNRNQERIPDNWYKRPVAVSYNVANVFEDLLVNNAMYPGLLRFGGNTGKVNTFTGVDFENVTGGVLNGETLLEGNNLACFILQASTANQPDLTEQALDLISSKLAPMISDLGCKQLDQTYMKGAYAKYPGAFYQATGVSK